MLGVGGASLVAHYTGQLDEILIGISEVDGPQRSSSTRVSYRTLFNGHVLVL